MNVVSPPRRCKIRLTNLKERKEGWMSSLHWKKIRYSNYKKLWIKQISRSASFNRNKQNTKILKIPSSILKRNIVKNYKLCKLSWNSTRSPSTIHRLAPIILMISVSSQRLQLLPAQLTPTTQINLYAPQEATKEIVSHRSCLTWLNMLKSIRNLPRVRVNFNNQRNQEIILKAKPTWRHQILR